MWLSVGVVTRSSVSFDETTGLWAASSYDAVVAIGRDAVRFSSAGGSRPDTGPLPWMIDLDGVDHTRRRQLVSRGFTPSRVRATAPRLRLLCDELIDAALSRGECDFVRDVAVRLPLRVISEMVGVPLADQDLLFGWTNAMLASLTGEPEGYARAAEAFGAWGEYAHRLIAERRAEPTDDLVSILVHAEVDGERLSDFEIAFEALLLFIGGDETTQQVAAGGMDQLRLAPGFIDELRAAPELIPNAVEEMLRWVSPIKSMARTTTAAVTLDAVEIPAGAKIVMLYEDANFDDAHFVSPERFDIHRTPNDHVAFGFGPHFCLGASLARVELQVVFDAALARFDDLTFHD